jgi:tetratricopeptide (TPR) repeat protein
LLLITSCSLPRIIILDDPLAPEERINLGVAYERRGKIDKAIEEYRIASKRLPIAYLYLGNAYMQKGDLYEAERYYRIAIRKVSNLSDAYNNLAWLYYTRGTKGSDLTAEDMKETLKEAERLALRAIEIDPSNENYKNTLNRIKELLYRRQ